ncbi:armadillo-type protein [Panaeolus papilionaceus]|nr:armadillo-type protein [Panaeolus papilionaceus]
MDRNEEETQKHFQALKSICVPLFGSSNLSPSSTKEVSTLLVKLLKTLQDVPPKLLTQNLIQYTFMPVSMLLQRNASADIPDRIIELIFQVMTTLVDSWWWFCDLKIWEQLFMLSGSVLGGIERNGMAGGNARDNETKMAAAQCLASLLRPRTEHDAAIRQLAPGLRFTRLQEMQVFVRAPKFEPIIGQTLDWLLNTASISHLPLQIASLDDIAMLLETYFPESPLPAVLPGVISTMTRICLGIPAGKGWANSEIASRALQVMQIIIPKVIGDDISIKHGLLSRVETLDDVFDRDSGPTSPPTSAREFVDIRTEAWLRGTSSQLHIALNTLSPLMSHPEPLVLRSLSSFSIAVIRTTGLTLPSTQPLLLSFLLVLSRSEYDSVSFQSRQYLIQILSKDFPRHLALQRILMDILSTNLASVPRLLSSQADGKLLHVAAQIEAICLLGCEVEEEESLPAITRGVGKILGPSGGIEKWGWQLLSAIQLMDPGVVITTTSSGQLALEHDPHSSSWIYFPEINFKNLSSRESQIALIGIMHALGSAGGENSLYAIEWFVQLGRGGWTDSVPASALWCATRLLEGLSGVSVTGIQSSRVEARIFPPRLQKEARSLARTIAESWDQTGPSQPASAPLTSGEGVDLVEHKKGLVPLSDSLRLLQLPPPKEGFTNNRDNYALLQQALRLQLLSVATSITQSRSSSLFIYILYPVLHSIVSPISFLSATGLATLRFITDATSYASPANLLLSNFDYIMDAVSRRFTRRWLDIDATKVMSIMVKLVGNDIVSRAEDLVEECFDRLDEYHGYSVVVDGLMEVLEQIIRTIEEEAKAECLKRSTTRPEDRRARLDDFFTYLPRRSEAIQQQEEDANYGPAPRQPWGDKAGEEDKTEESAEHITSEVEQGKPETPAQIITQKIVGRSMYFLTHDSPTIRAQVLSLLTSSVPVLAQSELIPCIHSVWPFILNRLTDSETFVVRAAAELVEALATYAGDLMFRKIWDDIWPKFKGLLKSLAIVDNNSAITRRTSSLDSVSAYSHSHRLYRSMLKTMTATLTGVHPHEPSLWELLVAFRRFLGQEAHEELKFLAKELYNQAGIVNPDATWLVLSASIHKLDDISAYLANNPWNITSNASAVLQSAA